MVLPLCLVFGDAVTEVVFVVVFVVTVVVVVGAFSISLIVICTQPASTYPFSVFPAFHTVVDLTVGNMEERQSIGMDNMHREYDGVQ